MHVAEAVQIGSYGAADSAEAHTEAGQLVAAASRKHSGRSHRRSPTGALFLAGGPQAGYSATLPTIPV
jgi:hypothetical protein